MVKCPLDCFLVYSFLLDVEQAKIRHAPFGTFAFSDKPLRNPSEHSDFWYIQGRIFSSCGLSETQGLPRSLVRFRAHRGEQQHIADGGAVGEQHHQTVHAEAQTARGGQAVLQCVHVVVVHLCLAVGLDGLALGHLTLKAALLVDGIVQLAEGVAVLGAVDEILKALGEGGVRQRLQRAERSHRPEGPL